MLRRISSKLAFGGPPAAVLVPLAAAVLGSFSGGCGTSRQHVSLMREFGSYEQDLTALNPQPRAADLLQVARTKRDRSRSEKGGRAVRTLEQGIADIRVARAMADMDQAGTRADICLRNVEMAHRRWEEMIVLLEQTEHVALRKAEDVPRQLPPTGEDAPTFPPSILVGTQPPAGARDAVGRAWTDWVGAAESYHVAKADLEAEFDREIASAEKAGGKEREAHMYLAGRLLQELELRVRGAIAERSCALAAARAVMIGDATDVGLRASLEMERGLKSDLRAELDRARAEAEDRQQSLYDAMRQLEGKYARISQEARGTIVSLADILFDFDKATLKRDVEFNLVKIATILNQFPEMRILVEGHTDNIGTPEYNLDLSQRRAQAVRDFLVTQDVSSGRMSVQGYGMSRPTADNATDEGRAKNRRVDLVIQEQP